MTNSAANEDAAARWAIKLDGGPLGTDEEAAFNRWLVEDVRRRGALLRAEATLAYLDQGRSLCNLTAEDEQGDLPSKGWSRRALLSSGISLVGIVSTGLAGFLLFRSAPIEIRTSLGEIRRMPLPDGSVASVNTASDIRVILSEKHRNVSLDKGEAWFQVAHDATRPFIVTAGSVHVQAVGTAFSVRRRNGGADVLVTDGVVAVWIEGKSQSRTDIAAGSMSFVAETAEKIKVESAAGAIDRALSWRAGELTLNGESLDYAIAEINRYNVIKLKVEDPDLGKEPLVGYFRIDQPENFGRAVAATLNVNMTIKQDAVYLSRKIQ